jgi:hypothetical protein
MTMTTTILNALLLPDAVTTDAVNPIFRELYDSVSSTFDLSGIASDGHDPNHPIAAR